MHADPYREAFYHFEREARSVFEPSVPSSLSLDECRALLRVAGAWPRVSDPLVEGSTLRVLVVDGYTPDQGPGMARFTGGWFEVSLPACRRQPWAVLP